MIYSINFYLKASDSLFISNFIAKRSTATTKRSADKGYPCLIPRLTKCGSDIQPFFKMQLLIPLYIVSTHLNKLWPNPNVLNELIINFHSKEAKDFEKSKNSTVPLIEKKFGMVDKVLNLHCVETNISIFDIHVA